MKTIAVSLLAVAALAVSSETNQETPVSTGLSTLYHLDPLGSRISFQTGREGGQIQDHQVKNLASDLDFGHYNEGAFTVGIEGGRRGVIVDLGSLEDLQRDHGYEETVGGGQGFASIRVEDGKIRILESYEKQSTRSLGSIEDLLGEDRADDHAPVRAGHVYLMRLWEPNDETFERFVKFLVVAHEPEVSVTLRWQVMTRE